MVIFSLINANISLIVFFVLWFSLPLSYFPLKVTITSPLHSSLPQHLQQHTFLPFPSPSLLPTPAFTTALETDALGHHRVPGDCHNSTPGGETSARVPGGAGIGGGGVQSNKRWPRSRTRVARPKRNRSSALKMPRGTDNKGVSQIYAG